MAREVMNDLIPDGKVTRGWLGVRIQDVTPDLAQALDLPTEIGVLIDSVQPDGPAAEAGLRAGDVIVEMDRGAVTSVRELRLAVARGEPGTVSKVTIYRDGRKMTLPITLGTFPDEDETPLAEKDGGSHDETIGLTVDALTPELAQRFELETTQGLVVTSVAQGSPAEEAGIEPGDLVREVNRKKVSSPRTYREALAEGSKDKPVLLLVERAGNTFFVALRGEE
jgi:serine protease Do